MSKHVKPISVVIDANGDLGGTYNRITQEVLIEIIKPYQQASLLCVSSAVENKSKSHLAGRMVCTQAMSTLIVA